MAAHVDPFKIVSNPSKRKLKQMESAGVHWRGSRERQPWAASSGSAKRSSWRSTRRYESGKLALRGKRLAELKASRAEQGMHHAMASLATAIPGQAASGKEARGKSRTEGKGPIAEQLSDWRAAEWTGLIPYPRRTTPSPHSPPPHLTELAQIRREMRHLEIAPVERGKKGRRTGAFEGFAARATRSTDEMLAEDQLRDGLKESTPEERPDSVSPPRCRAGEAAERLLCGMEQRAIEPGMELFQFLHEDERQVEFCPELDCDGSRHDVASYEAGGLRENEEVVVNPEVPGR
ncbi:hypothetical protein DL764_009834 [Monosporascus ibericus]|uniref:Uncharacterized protein n=1 Tax=Monosporascus ibericus TaxID=155417 RepID=A0A4V1X8V5_9PEZI|nr:hypothetical protein DL764_009834 [Monosporascus ibericus]